MSRLGKKPIQISNGVEVKHQDGFLSFKGPKGELSLAVLPFIKISLNDGSLTVEKSGDSLQARANWGTMAALIRNSMEGVSNGYEKKLLIEGVGYRVAMEGSTLVLNVGFSHPVKFGVPAGIELNTEKNKISVRGINKFLVGETAAKIRKIKKPEPYKGKGIRYEGEVVRRKAGKKVGSTG